MRRFFRSFSLVGGLLAMVLIGVPALAVPTFSNDDLKGEYLFTVVEVRREILPGMTTPVVQHCVIAGTAIFDGVGTMTADATTRCSITGTETETGKILYFSVSADGSFLMSEAISMSDPIHGQIVEHGRTLLLDGTTRTMPEILSWSGVMMRR